MARRRLPLQQQLLSNLMVITGVREQVELLLTHVTRLQAETISAAAAYGVKQAELADVAQLSRQRIGQIAVDVDATVIDTRSLNGQIHQVDGWPQDVMGALSGLAYPPDREDPARAEASYRQIAVVYGEEEARKRAAARSAFLSSVDSAPAVAEERAQRLQRAVYGPEYRGSVPTEGRVDRSDPSTTS